jgi:tRNA threonylcarbamoyladenosine biosynthesis protein TsaB
VLILAFDTATNVATSALVEDGKTLGERVGLPGRLLEDVNELFAGADAQPSALDRIVAGTGPGSFTSLRMGLAAARALALALNVQVAGCLL